MSQTFTFTHPGAYDAATGLFGTPTTTSYTGEAVQVSGGGDEYDRLGALGVVREAAVVLLWSPATYAENSLPPVGSVITWGTETLTLMAHLSVVAPDAVPIVARLGCRR
jgi:hypothetical protein